MTSDTAAPRPLRKDAARNRGLLVQAAREVFAERGLEASLDDVARHAGLGVGTAYRHFANKYELAQAIFADEFDKILALADDAVAMPDPWAGLVAFMQGAAEAQAHNRGLREVLMGAHDPEKMAEVNERISEPLRTLVERCKQAGVLRPDIDTTDVGVLVIMVCSIADIAGDAEPQLWQRYLPMLLAGLRADVDLPVPPMSEDAFRTAMLEHKERLVRLAGRR